MVRIGRNDTCTCGSGKKYKECCKQKTKLPSKEIPWVTHPEEFVLGELLRNNQKFMEFYLIERGKIKNEIFWAEDEKLPPGIDFRATRFQVGEKELVIRLRNLPANDNESSMIAHELLHLVLDEEGFPSTGSSNNQFNQVSSSLSSSVLDLIVTERLFNFGFDIRKDFIKEYNESYRLVRKESYPVDEPTKLLFIFNILSHILDYEQIQEKTGEFDSELLVYFKENLKELYEHSNQLYNSVKLIGYDTPEKVKQIFNHFITRFNLQKVIYI